MKKKSYLALFLSVLMALSILTSCGSKEPEVGTIAPIVEEPAPVPTEAPAEDPTEAPTEASTEAPAAEKAVSLGRMEGGVYTNSYTGYGCTLDSNWVFYTAEELQELPADAAELFADTELGDTAAQYSQIADMKADNNTNLSSIYVLYTQLPLQERLAYAALNHEQIIDATLAQKDLLISSFELSGMQVVSMEKVFVNFLGEERAAIKTVATIEGYDYYMLQIQDFGLGSYGVTLTISSLMNDVTEDVAAIFYPVD